MTPLIVIGGSAGGLEPLRTIVAGLPASLSAAVMVVIHTAPTGPSLLPKILTKAARLPAQHPFDSQVIQPGRIYVAPPDHHLTVDDGTMRVLRGPKFNAHRPAIDALFQSAARSSHPVVGVLLSGMDSDGSLGLKAIHDAGGQTILQSPDDATYPYMVKRATQIVEPDYVLPANLIAAVLAQVVATIESDISLSESDMSQTTDPDIEDTGKIPSPYSCPECGGVLWQDPKDPAMGYECRVGHVYSLDGLLTEQSESIEKALWMGLRALEEKQSLLERLAEQTRSRGLPSAAERFGDAAAQLDEPASVLRRLIQHNGLYAVPEPETDISESLGVPEHGPS
jgi:two-component system chemotaxis response regulator CheB